jgi:hypothetical protein
MKQPNYLAIHGARNGLLRIDVLKKPQPGTRRDFIRLLTCGSRKTDKAFWISFNDWEAFEVARILLWAVAKRGRKKNNIILELMR